MTDTIPHLSVPPSSVAELEAFIDRHEVRHHKIGVFDVDGVLRGKYVDRGKFLSAADKGFGFCDVVLGWDSADQLYDNTTVSGWHTGYRDAPVQLDPSTARLLPFEPNTVMVIGSFGGDYQAVCPRALLGSMVDRAAALGFSVKAALEYEFFVFNETPDSARDKGYRNLRPFTPGMFGYSVLRSTVHHELHHQLLDSMKSMDCEIEGLHTETGPGVIEAALRVDEARRAADKAALFKTFTKVLAQQRGMMATFMAKWSNEYPGQSGHIHISLGDAQGGTNRFFDADGEDGMSLLMRQFVAGQVKYMPELLAMVCSTVNAYRRLVPGMWAPTHANWGVENRTTAVRAIPGGDKGTRSEYRVGPADANPYLALAAALGSGLRGIEEGLTPAAPAQGNAYEQPGEGAVPLPSTLQAATQAFRGSAIARELFGDTFVDHFAATRDWEDREARKHVSDWDLARYFEII
ncbi:MAG: glutamine synthetase family protein [Deltaproteobacteria bacterium]|nr:glutamine synthetase family protein [Deltaproteobacteria bacterium]